MRPPSFFFSSFRLDLNNQLLWRDESLIPLRPKPLAVLRYLIEARARIVPKEELLRTLWPDTVVSGGRSKSASERFVLPSVIPQKRRVSSRRSRTADTDGSLRLEAGR
jgi:hypothetical protein